MGAQVFAFEHGGLTFAVPHSRVKRVVAALPDGAHAVPLFEGARTEAPSESYLELDLGPRPLMVSVRAPRLIELGEPRPLSKVLKNAMNLPHVVGWGELDDGIVWLVDPRRLPEE
jgi:hypothetical protein